MKTGDKSVRAAALTAAMMGLILTGCNTSRQHTDASLSKHPLQAPMPVAELMQHPDPHLEGDVAIAGCVAQVSLDEVEPDLHVLTLELSDKAPPPKPEAIVATVLDFSTPLNEAGNSYQAAAESEYQGFDQARIENMAYKLRASASRVRALSQFLQAKQFIDLGKATASVAAAYARIGDAYVVMSQLPAPPREQPVSPKLRLAPHEFETHMLSAAGSLNGLAESLVSARAAMLARELLAQGELPAPESAHLLLAYGSMMESRSWEERAAGQPSIAEEYRQMSKAFSLLGNGLAGMTDGLRAMQHSLVLREPTVPAEFAAPPTLRCAYVGYNSRILRDVRRKVAQLGAHTPVTVRGRVHRGNFREEVDTLWVHLDAVQIDGMTIDVSFGDESESVRKFQNIVAWIGDLDK
jgi:hypothetical protein